VGDQAVKQNHRGNVLLDGSKKLGWKAKVAPHNSGGDEHSCGLCHFGCGSGQKQGPAVSWLPAAHKAGAEFLEGFKVDTITFEPFATSQQRATGVKGKWTSRGKDGTVGGEGAVTREVVVKAKRTVISCGSLRSPLLLKNSGLSVSLAPSGSGQDNSSC
jgi:choline dehydrogenase-like flavoprotein